MITAVSPKKTKSVAEVKKPVAVVVEKNQQPVVDKTVAKSTSPVTEKVAQPMSPVATITPAKTPVVTPTYDLQELFDVGLHYGHQVRRWHPKMKPWIFMEKNGVHLFDLAKTAEQLQLAYQMAYEIGQKGKSLVVVCTKRQAREMVTTAAKEAGAMSITTRWLGGLLTNWDQVNKSLKRMIKTRKQLESGALTGRTKYELVQIEKDVIRLERFFGGIENLNQLPDALLVIDPVREKNAVTEANIMNIPVMALIDTDGNPTHVTLPIPGNDDAIKSITYVVDAVLAGYKAGRGVKEAAEPKPTVASTTTAPVAPVVAPKVEKAEVKEVKNAAEKTVAKSTDKPKQDTNKAESTKTVAKKSKAVAKPKAATKAKPAKKDSKTKVAKSK